MILHPLHTKLSPPERMNDPFDYEPHPLCKLAAQEVMDFLEGRGTGDGTFFDRDSEAGRQFLKEVREGKMFGILVVTPDSSFVTPHSSFSYLAAYSGQICGQSDWEGFVPAVFDYLQPDGYFKNHEAEIEKLGHHIALIETNDEYLRLKREMTALLQEAKEATDRAYAILRAGKNRRAQRRRAGSLSREEEAELIRESQFQKAEFRRVKRRYADEIGEKEARLQVFKAEMRALEHERKHNSRALQQWLFSHFEMLNAHGEKRNLLDIFAKTAFKIPPAGAGECCEPKLLQHAYAHGLRPLAMAMFWYGDSPKMEIRRHGQFYPACNGKCKPILQWMLGTERQETEEESHQEGMPAILYEDDDLIVINKPAGLLTIPGLHTRHSVYTIFRERHPELDSPFIVHRLDQATSGILLLGKNRRICAELQRQFTERTIRKRYVAVLAGILRPDLPRKGTISLPLRVDPFDRPRQVVDREHGKQALTEYEVTKEEDGKTWITLYPKTGRTHQLRVHCAHPDGLDCPIVGDPLYGQKAERLYLHAEAIEFNHPTTGKHIRIECKTI